MLQRPFTGMALALLIASPPAQADAPPSCAAAGAERLSRPPRALLDGALAGAGRELGDPELYVIYFGAGWCGPCRLQVRAMKAAYALGEPRGLGYAVVMVSRDRDAQAAAAYADAEAMPWPHLPPGAAGPAREVAALGGASLPDMVVVDRQGRVRCRAYGPAGRYLGVGPVFEAMRRALSGG